MIRSDFAFRVAGGGNVSELEGGFVDFVEFEEIGGFFSHLAREENKEASSKGVESASVTDFDFAIEMVAKLSANAGDDAEAGETSWFIDEDDLVGRVEAGSRKNRGSRIWRRNGLCHVLQYYNRCGIMKQ